MEKLNSFKRAFATATVIAATLAPLTMTHADDCAPLLSDLFQWGQAQPGSNVSTVGVTLASNQATFHGQPRTLVSYAEATLKYYPSRFIGFRRFPASFSSAGSSSYTGKQYFSDRTWFLDDSNVFDGSQFNGPFIFHDNYPFAPKDQYGNQATDPLNIAINWRLATYRVTVSSPKWGFSYSFVPECKANVMYGVGDGETLVTLSLGTRGSYAPPR